MRTTPTRMTCALAAQSVGLTNTQPMSPEPDWRVPAGWTDPSTKDVLPVQSDGTNSWKPTQLSGLASWWDLAPATLLVISTMRFACGEPLWTKLTNWLELVSGVLNEPAPWSVAAGKDKSNLSSPTTN